MKTIVNLVSQQTLPNYLFVKDMYQEGDRIIWIVTNKMEASMRCLEKVLPNIDHKKIVLETAKEENTAYIERILKENITTDSIYLVNITGSTKLISLSVYNFFKKFCNQSTFYYISIDKKNTIINIETQEEIAIKYRIPIDEYLALYGIRKKEEIAGPYLSFSDARYMYSLWGKTVLQSEEVEILREGKYKGKKKYKDDLRDTKITDLQDENIRKFILNNKFPVKKEGIISKYDVRYIVGGWLEDLMYYVTNEIEKPDDIFVGVHIYKGEDTRSDQELDVIFTKDNDFFIRECKTTFKQEGMFNEIVYKAAAIKSMFNSLGMKSSIYCCKERLNDDESVVAKMNETLKKMGVTYYGKKEIDDELNKLNQSSL